MRRLASLTLLAAAALAPAADVPAAVDVCVYGGTAGGVTAAIAAAKAGKSVLLVEPGRHLGGMTTGGLGATDIGNKKAIGGMSREFYTRLGPHYGEEISWKFTPAVAEATLKAMAAEHPFAQLMNHRLAAVEKAGATIKAITLEHAPPDDEGVPAAQASGGRHTVAAKVFIDATYEGDLMAKAGVAYHVGRESSATYDEPLNGIRPVLEPGHYDRKVSKGGHYFEVRVDPYKVKGNPASGLLPYIQDRDPGKVGDGDKAVQTYNFRLCMTKDAANQVPFHAPPGYDAANYELHLRHIEALVAAGKKPSIQTFGNVVMMPRGFTDMNNNNAVSTDFIGQNYDYPDSDWATRARIWRAHLHYIQGQMYFLTHDPRVPEYLRKEVGAWGVAKSEFADTKHWPNQMYVREARRMVGRYVITQADCEHKRAVDDAVGMGAYNMDSHNCQRVVLNGAVQNEGDVQVPPTAPYPVSYRTIMPKAEQCDNLIVPVCFSASHIAYGSARMEPVFMVLGQSAGVAACQAIAEGKGVQGIDVAKLQKTLLDQGQVLAIAPEKKPAKK